MRSTICFFLFIAIILVVEVDSSLGANIHPSLSTMLDARERNKTQAGTSVSNTGIVQIAPIGNRIFSEIYGGREIDGKDWLPVLIRAKDNVDFSSREFLKIQSHMGEFYSAYFALDKVADLMADKGDYYIEPAVRVQPQLDVSVPYIGVPAVWNSYNNHGEGVIVGIVDTGIDVDNEDFKDANGSRILYLWDQVASGTSPPGYSYGVEWTKSDIDNGNCTHVPTLLHGTHVAGIAVGNGRAANSQVSAGTYVGIADKADIIIVANPDNASNLLDGIIYIAQKASDLGMPWVINISMGTKLGPRNGTSSFEQAISGIPNLPAFQTGGQVIAIAAGNMGYDSMAPGARDVRRHASGYGVGGFTLNVNSIALDCSEATVLEIWYPQGENFAIAVYAPDGTLYGAFGPGTGTGDPGEGFYYDDAAGDGLVAVHNNHWDSDPYPATTDGYIFVVLQDLDDSGTCYGVRNGDWIIQMYGGTGRWDAYIVLNTPRKNLAAVDNSDMDNTRTVLEPANAHNIITVGAMTTTATWLDSGGTSRTLPASFLYPLNEVSYYSSPGPTRDGRTKPDILAPGTIIGSSLMQNPNQDPRYEVQYSTVGGLHYYAKGTSMAAPHIAGIAAIIASGDNSLSYNQIISCIRGSADANGCVQGFDAVKCALGPTSVTEPDFIRTGGRLSVYPNPANPRAEILFEADEIVSVQVDIIDIKGMRINALFRGLVYPGENRFFWNGDDFNGKSVSSGKYFVRLILPEEIKTSPVLLVR